MPDHPDEPVPPACDLAAGPADGADEQEGVSAEALAEEDDFSGFDPVALRHRHDGWSHDKQDGFIRALAETACVEEACARVGMSSAGAYKLRSRPDAQSFRIAWEAALDVGVSRLSAAAISRAIYGVPIPHFYQGEQVGEHRRYDERLTMWLLRYRDPVNYGKWLDRIETRQHGDGPAMILNHRLNELLDDCFGFTGEKLPLGPRYTGEEERPR